MIDSQVVFLYFEFSNRTYKAYYYGLYINTARNIIIDSCTLADSSVGIFSFVIGPAGKLF
jgi:hypothetical protein